MSISEHKHMSEPVRRMEVFTGAGRRRNWSPAEKASIVGESYGAGETVSGVARRHGAGWFGSPLWRRRPCSYRPSWRLHSRKHLHQR